MCLFPRNSVAKDGFQEIYGVVHSSQTSEVGIPSTVEDRTLRELRSQKLILQFLKKSFLSDYRDRVYTRLCLVYYVFKHHLKELLQRVEDEVYGLLPSFYAPTSEVCEEGRGPEIVRSLHILIDLS